MEIRLIITGLNALYKTSNLIMFLENSFELTLMNIARFVDLSRASSCVTTAVNNFSSEN